jgi:nitric oxide reductase subunit B
MSYKRYWVALAIVIIGSFAVLGGVGRKMISEAPPIPDVYNTDGQLLFTGMTGDNHKVRPATIKIPEH